MQLFPLPAPAASLVDHYQDDRYLAKIPEREYYGYYKVIEEFLRQDLGVPRTAAILDFGAGRCYYQKFFRDEGYAAVHSLEINRHMADYGRNVLGLQDVHESPDSLQPGSYDVVVSNQVFEHLANPLEVLANVIHPLLKDRGLVCFSVPNWDSLNRVLLGKRWLGYSPEDHVWFFSRPSISRLLGHDPRFKLHGTWVRSAVGKPYDGFRPSGLLRRFAYRVIMRASEALGRGDQLIVVLRKVS